MAFFFLGGGGGIQTALAVTVANVPYSWVKDNHKYFNVSIVEDIARMLGVLESAITLSVVEAFRGDQTKVAFLVGSSTSVAGNKVKSLRHFFGPFLAHFSALCAMHPTLAVWCVLSYKFAT